MTYYIAPSFLNKLAVHITKNYLELPQVKVPLILGIHGRKGEGKTFQCELVFQRMGVEVVHISGGELESPDAGDPARLIRLRYREAAELVRVRGRMAVLMINDLDAGAGRFDRMTQYTVNTQLVNNTLMNIADNPTNVQLPGSYDEKELPRIPIIATGNDFATLYAPLIRDGRMQKFYWEPSRKDRLGIVSGMYQEDGLSVADIEKLVTHFSHQAIDFFGAVRSQIYDEQITQFIHTVGLGNVASNVVNALKMPTFAKPNFQLEHLIEVGNSLACEQERVRTMGLVSEYNQAVTPTGYSARRHWPAIQRDPELLTPPATNSLKPYRLGKRDAQLTESQIANGKTTHVSVTATPYSGSPSPKHSANSNRFTPKSANPRSNGRGDRSALSPELDQHISKILKQGHRLGIEHVDKRRFRVNSWQWYGTFDPSQHAEASHQLSNCLQQFPGHYIRLVSIDRTTKRRMTETIIHRPVA